MARSVVFLDRDGVLNVDSGYANSAQGLRLIEGAVPGLRKLRQAGFEFIVITNQSGVARGFFSLDDVHNFHIELVRKIQAQASDIEFLGFMICPHHVDGKVPQYAITCNCRKPGTELIKKAQALYEIDLNISWLVGDKASDVDCALNAGIRGIQVTDGGKQYKHHSQAFAICPTLDQAADVILLNH